MKKMQDMGGFFVAAVTPYDERARAPQADGQDHRRGREGLFDRRQQRRVPAADA